MLMNKYLVELGYRGGKLIKRPGSSCIILPEGQHDIF